MAASFPHRDAAVIIPAYNVELSLGRCIDSALKQSLPPAEIIVVNDGSNDGTAKVAAGYGDKITFIEQENAGQGAARNRGLAHATATYIAFLDADDYWEPGFLERCVDFLNAHPDYVAVNVGCRVKRVDDESIIPSMLTRPDAPTSPILIDNFFEFWAEHDHVRTGSVLLRRETVEAAGYQRADLRISQDLEYWGYIATFGKWAFIPDILWVGDSWSTANKAGWFKKYNKRRRMCPTVDQWQERILPRLEEPYIPHFNKVRGRVAASYARNMILGGRPEDARQVVRQYGASMPPNRSTRLLRAGDAIGSVGWWLACRAVVYREYLHST